VFNGSGVGTCRPRALDGKDVWRNEDTLLADEDAALAKYLKDIEEEAQLVRTAEVNQYRNEDPIYGCQIWCKHPIVHAK
jgi:hypothetical protein